MDSLLFYTTSKNILRVNQYCYLANSIDIYGQLFKLKKQITFFLKYTQFFCVLSSLL